MNRDDYRFSLGQRVRVLAGARGLLAKGNHERILALAQSPRRITAWKWANGWRYMVEGSELWIGERFLDVPLEAGSWEDITRAIGRDVRESTLVEDTLKHHFKGREL